MKYTRKKYSDVQIYVEFEDYSIDEDGSFIIKLH
jgi:hypothetical protein